MSKLFNDSFEIFLRSFYAILLVDFLQNISLFLGIVLEYDRTFPPPSDKRNACKNAQKGSYFLLRHGGPDARTRIAKRVRSPSEEKVFKRLR